MALHTPHCVVEKALFRISTNHNRHSLIQTSPINRIHDIHSIFWQQKRLFNKVKNVKHHYTHLRPIFSEICHIVVDYSIPQSIHL